MSPKDGGPAFPVSGWFDDKPTDFDPGMSLRDWFAGQALSGLVSDPDVMTDASSCEANAKIAYRLADAMLRAREREGVA